MAISEWIVATRHFLHDNFINCVETLELIAKQLFTFRRHVIYISINAETVPSPKIPNLSLLRTEKYPIRGLLSLLQKDQNHTIELKELESLQRSISSISHK